MKEAKIVLIGAGSLTFTPSLVKGLLESKMATGSNLSICLEDVDKEILDRMCAVCVKMLDVYKRTSKDMKFKIDKQLDRRRALENADFIISTIGVGGIRATHADVDLPWKHGILQSIGDTVGPGGVFRALKHIPVFLDIARDIEDLCPNAFLFNYSNPMTPITRFLIRETRVKAYGLCTGIFGMRNFLANYMDVGRDDIALVAAGINHLSWVLNFTVKGERGYPLLNKKFAEKGAPKKNIGPLTFEFYKTFGLLPVAGDRHIAEFFPNLFMNQEAADRYDFPTLLQSSIYDLNRRGPVEKLVKEAAEGGESIGQFMSQKGLEEEGKGVVKIIESMVLDTNMLYPGINVVNDGVTSNLPSWALTEVPAYIDALGVHPLSVGPLPKDIAGVLNHRIAQFETLIDAAVSGDKNLLLRALLMDGYVKSIDQAKKLMEDMLESEKAWLPPCWFK